MPHKVRHFVWRACRNALPTKNNLRHRKIIQEELCDECKGAPEIVGHVLWGCLKAKEAWECSKLVISGTMDVNASFQDVMWKLLMGTNVGDDHVAQAATTAWALWHNRNEVRHGGVRKSGQQVFRLASDYLREYRAAVSHDTPVATMSPQGAVWARRRGDISK